MFVSPYHSITIGKTHGTKTNKIIAVYNCNHIMHLLQNVERLFQITESESSTRTYSIDNDHGWAMGQPDSHVNINVPCPL